MVSLILASQSPRRRELLRQAGYDFRVLPANVPEAPEPGESAAGYVKRLARQKAEKVAAEAPDAIVLGADTTVVRDGIILEKPADAADAARMLRHLSGGEHDVFTGICLIGQGKVVSEVALTRVWFCDLSQEDIAAYVATGEPMDKAGAYGIQGYASRFVDRIEGCYFNIVGLPVSLVFQSLKQFGY